MLQGLGADGEAETGLRVVHYELGLVRPPGNHRAGSVAIYQMVVAIHSESGTNRARRHKSV